MISRGVFLGLSGRSHKGISWLGRIKKEAAGDDCLLDDWLENRSVLICAVTDRLRDARGEPGAGGARGGHRHHQGLGDHHHRDEAGHGLDAGGLADGSRGDDH